MWHPEVPGTLRGCVRGSWTLPCPGPWPSRTRPVLSRAWGIWCPSLSGHFCAMLQSGLCRVQQGPNAPGHVFSAHME